MTSIESLLKVFISDFFTSEEKLRYMLNYDEFNNESDFSLDFSSDSWSEITDLYSRLLPYSNMNNFRLEVAESCSYFIERIFKNEVDDNTFVISTTHEHPNTNKCLDKCKNKILLNFDEIRIQNVDSIVNKIIETGVTKDINKVFVYMVGTSTCSGQIVSTTLFEKIKKQLDQHNIKNVLCCDDVHGMFITPRCYDLFDYVLYTCHSLVQPFNMGLLWSKNKTPIGFTNYNRALLYYDKLKLFLSKIDKIRLFNLLLTEYFSEDLSNVKYLDLYTNITPHIFALKTKGLAFNQDQYDMLGEYNIRIGEHLCYENFIRLRIQEFVTESPEFLIEGLQKCKKVISRSIKMSEIKDINFTGECHISNTFYNK